MYIFGVILNISGGGVCMCVHIVYYLVLMTGTLAVFSQALHSLVDESYILLIDVESQQPQSSCGTATDTV